MANGKTLVDADIERLYGLEQRVAEGDYAHPHQKWRGCASGSLVSAPQGRLPDGRRLVISMAMGRDGTAAGGEKSYATPLEEKDNTDKKKSTIASKNNLQIIVSLLNLQAAGIRNQEVLDIF